MRYPASEKLEIIRLVEQSHLAVSPTLAKLGIADNSDYDDEFAPTLPSTIHRTGTADAVATSDARSGWRATATSSRSRVC